MTSLTSEQAGFITSRGTATMSLKPPICPASSPLRGAERANQAGKIEQPAPDARSRFRSARALASRTVLAVGRLIQAFHPAG